MFAPNPPPTANHGPIWIGFDHKPTSPFVDGEIAGLNGASKPNGGQVILNFVDKNNTAGILEYQLNFVDRNGNKSALDPDITNGGKGFWAIGDPTTLLIGAVVAVALLFVWLSRVRPSGRNNAKMDAGADSNQVG
jgi:hypothetical protein